ncbi:amino acid aminotransferase [Entomomonas asaccharolytica]|uniref:Aminotransferase n=1 Tax=Entomomonas asaccharolytica TaxID=2785331 RepID=A0A974ND38_9GAMM|nr:amino acid aminotransferase [Entomomonas asaccharolytica]QQP84551.1 aspartate/tyrosine/aromatic aminotransferase [Entomomonas asaccharolytica]
MNLFADIELAPRDPILGLNEAYQADTRTNKINLGVGVYYDEQGRIPLLKAVQKAEAEFVAAGAPHSYLPIEGIGSYDQAVQKLLFGADSPLVTEKRVVTVQALGGTGALKLGADFIKTYLNGHDVAISNPSWENHRALFSTAGFVVHDYSYYDSNTHGLDRNGLLADLKALPKNTVVVLHGCCHNPTGVDLTQDDWKQVLAVVKEKQLIPFIDIAYQGFGNGVKEDAFAVRLFAESGLNFFVSSSFSKSFSLYGERVGALSLVTNSADEATRVLSQVKRVIRTNYSNPPIYGAMLVSKVLNSPELYKLWDDELSGMRDRIKAMRNLMVEQLSGAKQDFSFIAKQCGMFSYSGLTADQVDKLRNDYGIYAVATGRICVAALNNNNIKTVTDAILQVI